jgi:phosphonate transport system ATP-binding protein
LRLKGVGVTYPGGVRALLPQDIEIRKGEVTVLLGRSGAGKSTLLRAMNLLVQPTDGAVICPQLGELGNGRLVRQHRRRTGMVFQQHQLIGRQTALTNVLAGRISRFGTLRSLFSLPREDRELALNCLDRVGMLDKALQRVDQLSGGQQQRVGVARALAMEPTLVLADEPVASLDPATSRQLLTLLREICRRDGITLVISLHQVEYAREFGDRVIALAKGDVVFDDVAEKLDESAIDSIYEGEGKAPDAEAEDPSATPDHTTQEQWPVARTV